MAEGRIPKGYRLKSVRVGIPLANALLDVSSRRQGI